MEIITGNRNFISGNSGISGILKVEIPLLKPEIKLENSILLHDFSCTIHYRGLSDESTSSGSLRDEPKASPAITTSAF